MPTARAASLRSATPSRRMLALVALALAACSAPAEPTARQSDSRPASVDALLPERPGDPRWRLLPGLGHCDASLAADPVALGRALVWEPCPKGQVPGCRILRPDPGDPAWPSRNFAYELQSAWTEAGVLLAIHDRGAVAGRPRLTLAALDSPPFLVLDLDHEACQFHRVALSDTTAAIAILDDHDRDASITRFLVGPLHADAAWHTPLASTAANTGKHASVTLSGQTIVVDGVLRFDPSTGGSVSVAAAPSPTCCGFAVGSSTVFLADGQLLVTSDVGAAPRPLGARAGRLADLRLQGGAFYWLAGVDPVGEGFMHIEMWTAPASDDPAQFAPRKLADLPLHFLPGLDGRDEIGPLVIGRDHVAVRHLEPEAVGHRITIVDVATGARRKWLPDPGVVLWRLQFVGADEIGVLVGLDGQDAILRIPIASIPLQ